MLFVGIDWSDQCLEFHARNGEAQVLAQGRVEPNWRGMGELFATLEQHAPQYLVFDSFDTQGKRFVLRGERCNLLLCVRVHPSELSFARTAGPPALLAKLRAAEVYPFSDVDRPPVA